MNAAATLAAWKDYSIGHSRSGCDNTFTHSGVLYSFDANPRALQNGALQGRCYRQEPGESPTDIGGFKINGDGTVAALPEELRGVLPDGPTIRVLALGGVHTESRAIFPINQGVSAETHTVIPEDVQ